jgi:hypothetical protein
MTEQSIGDILNNEPATEAPVEAPPEAETPTEAVTEPTETVERPRGPDGKFVAKESTGVQPQETPAEPVPPTDRLPQAEYAALKDERSKRQALENELAQLRQQMQRQPPQPQPQAEVPPDQWEDPDGYRDWLIETVRNEARAEATEAFHVQRIVASVAQFSADKPDYQDVIGFYRQMASVNPGLDEQMKVSENPAKFAYDTAKLQLAIQQHGSLQGYIDAQIAAKQTEALSQVQAQLPQSAPPTISSDRSVGARSGPAWSGPAPLSELLR